MALGQTAIKFMDLEHGCRSEYGPLELRIQATSMENGFIVYIEDPRLTHPAVHEQQALSTLEAAKASAEEPFGYPRALPPFGRQS